MSGKAAKVVISEKQRAILQRIANAKTAQARLIQRANIILLAFQGELNTDIAEQVDLSRSQSSPCREVEKTMEAVVGRTHRHRMQRNHSRTQTFH
jgi:hypothetical protein